MDNIRLIGQTDDQRVIAGLIRIFGDDYPDANGDLCIKENEVYIFKDFAKVFEKSFKILNVK